MCAFNIKNSRLQYIQSVKLNSLRNNKSWCCMQEMHWKIEKSRTKIESRSAMRILLRKNALDNEKLVSRDSAYCLHFSALAFYIFQHRLGFIATSRLLVSLFFSVGWQWGRRDAIRDATRARPSRDAIFLSPLFCIGSRLM